MEIFPGISSRPQTNLEVCLDWSGDIEECKQKKNDHYYKLVQKNHRFYQLSFFFSNVRCR